MTRKLFTVALLLVLVVQQVSGRLVMVNLSGKNASRDATDFCTLYGLKDTRGLETVYSLEKIELISACQNLSLFTVRSGGAIFLEIFNDECSFDDVFAQFEFSNRSLAIIGSNSLNNFSRELIETPFTFMPLDLAGQFMVTSDQLKSPIVILKEMGLYDHSILIVMSVAVFIIIFSSFWNFILFRKAIKLIKTNKIKAKKSTKKLKKLQVDFLDETRTPAPSEISIAIETTIKQVVAAETEVTTEESAAKASELKVKEYDLESNTDSEDFNVDGKKSTEVHSTKSGPDVEAIENSVVLEEVVAKIKKLSPVTEIDQSKNLDDQEARISMEMAIVEEINKKIEKDENASQKSVSGDTNKEPVVHKESVIEARAQIEKGSASHGWKDYFNWQTDLKNYSFISMLVAFLICFVIFAHFAYNASAWIVSLIFWFFATISLFSHGCILIDQVNLLGWRVITYRPKLSKLIYLFICTLFSVVWFGCRTLSWAWGLQDVLVISLTTFILKFNLFKSYKYILVVYALFIIYDMVMIYILPSVDKKASVMNSIGFGLKASYDTSFDLDRHDVNLAFSNRMDHLPLYLIFPDIGYNKVLCNFFLEYPYSIMGMGEIIIPALSINYAIRYDTVSKTKVPIYFILNIIGLVFGYFIAGICVAFVAKPQAPILTTCPFLIGLSLLCALLRQEFATFFFGKTLDSSSLGFRKQFKRQFTSDWS